MSEDKSASPAPWFDIWHLDDSCEPQTPEQIADRRISFYDEVPMRTLRRAVDGMAGNQPESVK